MPTQLGVEAEIAAFLTRRGLDVQRFCTIVGHKSISATKMFKALGDVKPLDPDQSAIARKAIADIERLLELSHPLPVSLKDPALIKKLLVAMAEERLSVHIFISDRNDWTDTEITEK